VPLFDFQDGNGPVPAHQHSDGGGWVADTAYVDDSVYVGPDALVFDSARVYAVTRRSTTRHESSETVVCLKLCK
jgi:hypothetical protein